MANACSSRRRDRLFLDLLKPGGRLRIAQHFGIEVHDGDDDAVFHSEVAQLVQIRLPAAVLREIIGHAFGEEDVPGIAAVHHLLRDVDPGPGDVLALVHIGHVMHRSAVNANPQRQARFCAQSLADLERAIHRLFHGTSENQRHAIAGRRQDQLPNTLRFARRVGVAHDLIKLVQSLGVLVNQQLRITYDVDEQDMRDFSRRSFAFCSSAIRNELYFVP